SVDIIDATRSRFVSFEFDSFADALAFQTETEAVRRNGLLAFDKLPPHLSRRVFWDDTNDRLIFRGQNVQFVAGEDMLLPNVMTTREREVTRLLSPENAIWTDAVDRLYDATNDVVIVQSP